MEKDTFISNFEATNIDADFQPNKTNKNYETCDFSDVWISHEELEIIDEGSYSFKRSK